MSDTYTEGYEARRDGKTLADNPYPADTDYGRRLGWQNGWVAGAHAPPREQMDPTPIAEEPPPPPPPAPIDAGDRAINALMRIVAFRQNHIEAPTVEAFERIACEGLGIGVQAGTP